VTRIPNMGRKTSWEAIRDYCISPSRSWKTETSPLRQPSQSEMVSTVTLFQSRKYKLYVSVGVSRAVLAPVKAVFDTGAGPNIVLRASFPRFGDGF
jgi:hypothetical protein